MAPLCLRVAETPGVTAEGDGPVSDPGLDALACRRALSQPDRPRAPLNLPMPAAPGVSLAVSPDSATIPPAHIYLVGNGRPHQTPCDCFAVVHPADSFPASTSHASITVTDDIPRPIATAASIIMPPRDWDEGPADPEVAVECADHLIRSAKHPVLRVAAPRPCRSRDVPLFPGARWIRHQVWIDAFRTAANARRTCRVLLAIPGPAAPPPPFDPATRPFAERKANVLRGAAVVCVGERAPFRVAAKELIEPAMRAGLTCLWDVTSIPASPVSVVASAFAMWRGEWRGRFVVWAPLDVLLPRPPPPPPSAVTGMTPLPADLPLSLRKCAADTGCRWCLVADAMLRKHGLDCRDVAQATLPAAEAMVADLSRARALWLKHQGSIKDIRPIDDESVPTAARGAADAVVAAILAAVAHSPRPPAARAPLLDGHPRDARGGIRGPWPSSARPASRRPSPVPPSGDARLALFQIYIANAAAGFWLPATPDDAHTWHLAFARMIPGKAPRGCVDFVAASAGQAAGSGASLPSVYQPIATPCAGLTTWDVTEAYKAVERAREDWPTAGIELRDGRDVVRVICVVDQFGETNSPRRWNDRAAAVRAERPDEYYSHVAPTLFVDDSIDAALRVRTASLLLPATIMEAVLGGHAPGVAKTQYRCAVVCKALGILYDGPRSLMRIAPSSLEKLIRKLAVLHEWPLGKTLDDGSAAFLRHAVGTLVSRVMTPVPALALFLRVLPQLASMAGTSKATTWTSEARVETEAVMRWLPGAGRLSQQFSMSPPILVTVSDAHGPNGAMVLYAVFDANDRVTASNALLVNSARHLGVDPDRARGSATFEGAPLVVAIEDVRARGVPWNSMVPILDAQALCGALGAQPNGGWFPPGARRHARSDDLADMLATFTALCVRDEPADAAAVGARSERTARRVLEAGGGRPATPPPSVRSASWQAASEPVDPTASDPVVDPADAPKKTLEYAASSAQAVIRPAFPVWTPRYTPGPAAMDGGSEAPALAAILSDRARYTLLSTLGAPDLDTCASDQHTALCEAWLVSEWSSDKARREVAARVLARLGHVAADPWPRVASAVDATRFARLALVLPWNRGAQRTALAALADLVRRHPAAGVMVVAPAWPSLWRCVATAAHAGARPAPCSHVATLLPEDRPVLSSEGKPFATDAPAVVVAAWRWSVQPLGHDHPRVAPTISRPNFTIVQVARPLEQFIALRREAGEWWDTAHCVATDGAMGAGIAKWWADERITDLRARYQEALKLTPSRRAIPVHNSADYPRDSRPVLYNLRTKESSGGKPLLPDVRKAIDEMFIDMRLRESRRLVCPRISAGIDGIPWQRVLATIMASAAAVEPPGRNALWQVVVCTVPPRQLRLGVAWGDINAAQPWGLSPDVREAVGACFPYAEARMLALPMVTDSSTRASPVTVTHVAAAASAVPACAGAASARGTPWRPPRRCAGAPLLRKLSAMAKVPPRSRRPSALPWLSFPDGRQLPWTTLLRAIRRHAVGEPTRADDVADSESASEAWQTDTDDAGWVTDGDGERSSPEAAAGAAAACSAAAPRSAPRPRRPPPPKPRWLGADARRRRQALAVAMAGVDHGAEPEASSDDTTDDDFEPSPDDEDSDDHVMDDTEDPAPAGAAPRAAAARPPLHPLTAQRRLSDMFHRAPAPTRDSARQPFSPPPRIPHTMIPRGRQRVRAMARSPDRAKPPVRRPAAEVIDLTRAECRWEPPPPACLAPAALTTATAHAAVAPDLSVADMVDPPPRWRGRRMTRLPPLISRRERQRRDRRDTRRALVRLVVALTIASTTVVFRKTCASESRPAAAIWFAHRCADVRGRASDGGARASAIGVSVGPRCRVESAEEISTRIAMTRRDLRNPGPTPVRSAIQAIRYVLSPDRSPPPQHQPLSPTDRLNAGALPPGRYYCPQPPAAAQHGVEQLPPDRAANVASHLASYRCAACNVRIPPLGQGSCRFCDAPSCRGEEFAVCRGCAPRQYDDTRGLRCVRHQMGPLRRVPPSAAQAEGALKASKAGTLARWVARLWALATSVDPGVIAMHPLHPGPAADTPMARLLAASKAASAEDWNPSRCRKTAGPAHRLHQLAYCERVDDAPASAESIGHLVHVYISRRIRGPRLDGWQEAGAPHVANECSSIKAASLIDGMPLPAYCGDLPKALLANMGAFEKANHTRSLPVTPCMIEQMAAAAPPEWADAQAAAEAASVFAFRAGATSRVENAMLQEMRAHDASSIYFLRWNRRHKTRQGDKALPASEATVATQFVAVCGPMIDRAVRWSRAQRPPPHDPRARMWPCPPARVAQYLRLRIAAKPGFTIRTHGIRAGTASALQALGVPRDVIAAWGWWARTNGATGHYAALLVNVMLEAARRLHLVDLEPVSPGFSLWRGMIGNAPVPRWASLPAYSLTAVPAPAAPVPAAPGDGEGDDASSDEAIVVGHAAAARRARTAARAAGRAARQ